MKPAKSPSCPSRSLADCFDEGMKLYDAYPNASFDQAQIASVFGLSVTSGFFKGLLSDIKQYGLIEKSGANEFVVSSALKEYSIADNAEKRTIRYELAVRPKVFSQILDNQGNHLPAEATLVGVLIARFGFNKARASKVGKALRSSLEWAEAIDAKGNVIRPSVDNEDSPDNTAIPEGSIEKNDETSPIQLDPIVKKHDLISEVPIGDGRKVRIEYPDDLTEKEANKVGLVLKALSQME